MKYERVIKTLTKDRDVFLTFCDFPVEHWKHICSMSDLDIKEISDRLNNTPRKCLGWKTPAEVFREKMMEKLG